MSTPAPPTPKKVAVPKVSTLTSAGGPPVVPPAPEAVSQAVLAQILVYVQALLGQLPDPPKTVIVKDAIAAVTALVGVVVSLGAFSAGTAQVIVAAAAILIPGVWRVLAAFRAHTHAKVTATALTALVKV